MRASVESFRLDGLDGTVAEADVGNALFTAVVDDPRTSEQYAKGALAALESNVEGYRWRRLQVHGTLRPGDASVYAGVCDTDVHALRGVIAEGGHPPERGAAFSFKGVGHVLEV